MAGKGGARPGAGRKKNVPNKATTSLKELARKYTDDALLTLADIMADEAEPAAARVSAANAILDRGYGKATTMIGGDEDSPLSIVTRIILEAGNGNGSSPASA